MESLSTLIFILSAIVPILFFGMYPIWLKLLPDNPIKKSSHTSLPSVTVVVAVRNAAPLLKDKIENTLALDYPQQALDILFISDGSTDETLDILNKYSSKVRLLETKEHTGKNNALNTAFPHITTEVVLFTDADAMLETDALLRLVAPLTDPTVGGACGRRRPKNETTLGLAQQKYFQVDALIKQMESRAGSITSNDGKIFAMRTSLLSPLPEGVTDDLYAALSIVRQGYRFVFEPLAIAEVQQPSRTPRHEIERRRRIVTGSLRGISAQAELLNPQKFGAFSLSLVVNKIVRRMLPLSLIGLFVSSWMLANHFFFAIFLWGQLFCYALAGTSSHLQHRGPRKIAKISEMALYFTLGNWGTLLALIDLTRGKKVARWNPVKHDKAQETPRRLAYIMSRFPKITETFVLYEILEMQKRGQLVEIYPLLREHQQVAHPEALGLMKRAHYTPLFSGAVLMSNFRALGTMPLRWLSALTHIIHQTATAPKICAKNLAVFPLSIHFALDMQARGVTHIHAHFATYPTTTALVCHTLCDIPYSFTAHAHDIFMDQHFLASKIQQSTFTVLISEFNRQFLREKLGPTLNEDKLCIIHCGVDPSIFQLRADKRTPGPCRLLCVGSFKDMKGHTYLLEACALLRKQGLEFECTLIGDGPLQAKVEMQIAHLDLDDHVHLTGPLPREEVARLTRDADIAVLASVQGERGDMDGIPVALMEAMVTGLPVVSTRLSGIPELVTENETGLLADTGNHLELAAHLEKLILNPELARNMGKAGRTKVLRDFDLRTNAANLAKRIIR
ncbi:MAG: glycosyltransferase [Desulfovibrio sp.]